MGYTELILIFAAFWMVQVVFTLKQRKHMQQTMNEVQSMHQSGYLGVGVSRAKFNMGPGVVMILVVDENNKIATIRILKGISVFAKFKQRTDYDGKDVYEVEFSKKDKILRKAFQVALEQIEMVKKQREE